MDTIAVYSIKGGVGKTATAVNVALLSAQDGARTLLWDLDPQGAATYTFRVRPKVKGGRKALVSKQSSASDAIKGTDYPRLDLLPADFSYRHLDLSFHEQKKSKKQLARILEPLAGEYDRVILDCAPSISLVSENIFQVADALLVPTIPTVLSVRMLQQLLDHRRHRKGFHAEVVPFFSMVDRRKALHREVCADARRRDVGFLEAEIPYSSLVERMGIECRPVVDFAARSRPAAAYRALWQEFCERRGRGARRKRVQQLLEDMQRGDSADR